MGVCSTYFEHKLQVEEKFGELRDFLTGKPYTHHLVTPFFAVENSLEGDEEVGYLPWLAAFVTCSSQHLVWALAE